MMPWRFEPRGFDRLDQHLGATDIVGMVLMIVLWAVIIMTLVLGIRALILYSRGRSLSASEKPNTVDTSSDSQETPPLLAILEERYARGEIDRDDFLKHKKDLGLA